jgi:hypothetical protein
MSKERTSGFHARGEWDFRRAIESDLEYQKKCETGKRQRIESLLSERLEEFQRVGYWQRQAILKKIHLQVNREFSKAYCLF